MAVTFLEPGGDATFLAAATTAGGFWSSITGSPTVATDFVHGSHKKSYTFRAANADSLNRTSVLQDSGTRISLWLYFNALPLYNPGKLFSSISSNEWWVQMTTGGVLQLFTFNTQLGSNGPTLSTGNWYRIILSYTVTSTTVNRFELKVFDSTGTNQIGSISVTNGTLQTSAQTTFTVGNLSAASALDLRVSDIYIDNGSTLDDPGNIWITAKRPNANGTTTGFTTQIGSGGSGYPSSGGGHSPQVNERALSNTNGWSMVGAGSAVTEEYNIEGKSVGDIDISTATIVDWLGWADMKSLAGETVQIILNGANNSQAIISTETLYTKIKGSTTYPAGTGSDIGIITTTALTTVSLYECGVIVAYIPAAATTTSTTITTSSSTSSSTTSTLSTSTSFTTSSSTSSSTTTTSSSTTSTLSSSSSISTTSTLSTSSSTTTTSSSTTSTLSSSSSSSTTSTLSTSSSTTTTSSSSTTTTSSSTTSTLSFSTSITTSSSSSISTSTTTTSSSTTSTLSTSTSFTTSSSTSSSTTTTSSSITSTLSTSTSFTTSSSTSSSTTTTSSSTTSTLSTSTSTTITSSSSTTTTSSSSSSSTSSSISSTLSTSTSSSTITTSSSTTLSTSTSVSTLSTTTSSSTTLSTSTTISYLSYAGGGSPPDTRLLERQVKEQFNLGRWRELNRLQKIFQDGFKYPSFYDKPEPPATNIPKFKNLEKKKKK